MRDTRTHRSPASLPLSEWTLTVTRPSDQGGRHIALPSTGEVTIGRDEVEVTLRIDDASVSRKHAKVVCGADAYIIDLGSKNGTRVGGTLLAPNEPVRLTLGAVIELGSAAVIVQPRDASPGPPSQRAPTIEQPEHYVLLNEAMKRAYELLRIVADSPMCVLILGETGSGKDVYAAEVHRASRRREASFVRLNCAALPENLLEAELFGYERGAFTGAVTAKQGLLETAHGGTVFLDEIGEMPLTVQAKLLRVLESGEVMRLGSVRPKRVDVRFIAATHRDLETHASTGAFRQDLYFRINGVSVYLPPLRERTEEILPLADFFLKRVSSGRRVKIADDAKAALLEHAWPGNVRELKNVVERAALLSQGSDIRREHVVTSSGRPRSDSLAPPAARATMIPLPPPAPSTARDLGDAPRAFKDEMADVERRRILEALEQCAGNQTRAAQKLGIARSTLVKRLDEYGIARPRK